MTDLLHGLVRLDHLCEIICGTAECNLVFIEQLHRAQRGLQCRIVAATLHVRCDAPETSRK